jgi:aminopeptidase-like protein/aminoglycoside N3'-acetyltransferase
MTSEKRADESPLSSRAGRGAGIVADGSAWSQADLARALRSTGLESGDTVYFQVCAETLGPAEGVGSDEDLCRLLLGALQDVVGEDGTILAPAFTFSFCRQEVFSPEESPTLVGPWNTFTAFPDYLHRLPGALRSKDPIFSTAGIGPRAAELLTNLPRVCLGEDSVHDRLRRAGGKICILGVGLYECIFRHYVESVSRVPWRFDKLFTGRIREGGAERKEGWLYNVRIRASNGDPAGEPLEALAREKGICRSAPVGEGELVTVEAEEFFQFTSDQIRRNPWYTARGPAGDPVAIEEARTDGPAPAAPLPPNASMDQIIESLWELPRDILSNGYDAALKALATQVPMKIHEYPTGTQCWTWIVPEKWTCHEAYLETMDGQRLFSYADHPLHVVSYSLPVDRVVTRDELLRHLHVHPRIPEAVPFIFKYYERDWGLCCSRVQREALTEDRYRVVIRTSFSYATMKVGEIVIPGETEESVVLEAHLCHPHMVNDDMTGVAVAIDVARALRARKNRRYTYRILIVPETIGTVAFLSHNEHLIPRMKAGLFLEMLGKGLPHSLQSSLFANSEADECFELALAAGDPEGWVGPFGMVIGNDEKQFNGPGVRIPMLSLSRVLPASHPDHPYREYHSSHDTPAILAPGSLEASRDLVLSMLDTFESNRVPVNRFKGEVFCSRYGIHIDWYKDPEGNVAFFSVMARIDGTRTIAEIAREIRVPFERVRGIVADLAGRGLVSFR